jgi:diguanylate cyclase (GGDEF)-like protein
MRAHRMTSSKRIDSVSPPESNATASEAKGPGALYHRPPNDNDVISRVADATSRWDREALDEELSRLLLHFLAAKSVTLIALEDVDSIRSLTQRVHLRATAEIVAGSRDGARFALAEKPEYDECIKRNEVMRFGTPDGTTCTLFPIQDARAVQGLLAVDRTRRLTAREEVFVHGILRILQNHLALLEYGQRDTLTGLLNRKTFESHFEKVRHRVTQGAREGAVNEPGWLALLDIDRFKSINDSHGHLFGDEVLLLVSQIMKRTFRGADQLFRFGGEEFVIVLEHATEAGAVIAFERLRASIEAHSFPQVGRVTVSMGFTRVLITDPPTVCVERADAALYYAKEHGRNNVQNFDALLAEGKLRLKQDTAEAELF